MTKYGNIALLKFLFSIVIVFVHFTFIGCVNVIDVDLFKYLQKKALFATTVVDFFFIISSFLCLKL